MALDEVQGRILGSLVEKELTTPQQYPLTLNALMLACNQASNRDPVMLLSEAEVQRGLDALKGERLVRFVFPSHGRSAVRYRHVLDEALGLEEPARALLGVLLLRGPQTVGELRARTERMARFDQLQDVDDELGALARRSEPLVARLGRRPGQKEERYQQLLAATPAAATPAAATAAPPTAAPAAAGGPATVAPAGAGWPAPGDDAAGSDELRAPVAELRAQVAELRAEVAAMRADVQALRDSLGG